jgi:hypothetical protein
MQNSTQVVATSNLRRNDTMQLGRTILIAIAFSAVALAADQSAAEKELLKIESEWFQAYFHADAATMNRIEGEDCLVITGGPNRRNELEPLHKSRSFSRRSDHRRLVHRDPAFVVVRTVAKLLN